MTTKLLMGTLSWVVLMSSGLADDWPQWRGPNREDISRETGLHLDWSEKKPPLLWAFKQAGAGYSATTIVGTTLYCQGAADGSDFAFALDTETGKLKWKQQLGAQFKQDRGDGPRGSVTVDDDALYLIRGGGELNCLTTADGRQRWKKDLRSDLGGAIMSQWDWGFSESPLVDGDLVICTPGGSKGTLAALNKKTGEVVWRSVDWQETGGYSSPIVAEVDGVRQVIQLTRGGVAGVAAKDGTLLWSVKVARNDIAVIPTPIYHDHLVYVTSGYGAGGWKEFGRLELPEKSKIRTMDNKVWTHPVVANGKLYLRHHDLLFCYDLKAK